VIRDRTGSYDLAFYLAAGLCVIAAFLSVSIRVPSASVADEPALAPA
jgi:hypothetical protein